MGGVLLLLSIAWKSYEADKRIEGFSSYTLKAYGIQAKLLIDYFKIRSIDSFDTEGLRRISCYSRERLKTL
jgi:integrase/recombinase XerD